MDLNADGKLDILSGCYDCLSEVDPNSQNMAGLFHVLYGKEDNKFSKAKVLEGTDGEPLISGSPLATEDEMKKKEDFDEDNATEEELEAFYSQGMDNFCTRPSAGDLNGDGFLDLVVGNAAGTFFMTKGTGKGEFDPTSIQLKVNGKALRVSDKSDPCLVDWDADGDLDIVSGSGQGGVFLATNVGSKTAPEFEQFEELVAPVGFDQFESKFGDEHIKGPSASTRVCVADVNGDGALDLLVGDSVMLMYPAEGLDEKEVAEKLEVWEEKMNKVQAELMPKQQLVFEKFNELADKDPEDREAMQAKLEEELNELYKDIEPLQEERSEIVREEMTGYVWVYYQKSRK